MNIYKIFKNILYLLFSNILIKVFSALAMILIAKHLGPASYGILSIGIAIAAVASYFTDLGTSNTFIREATKVNMTAEKLLYKYAKIKFFLTITVIFIISVIILISYKDALFRLVLLTTVILSVIGISMQGFANTFFQAKQQMKNIAIIKGLSGIFITVLFGLAIFFKMRVELVAFLYGFSNILAGLIGIKLMKVKIEKNDSTSPLLNGLSAFAIAGLIATVIPQMGPIILEKVSSAKTVGFFMIAFRIPAALYQLPGIVASAFYPVLFELANQKKYSEHEKLSVMQVKLMSFFGLLMSIPLFLFADEIINLLFGESWGVVSTSLVILSGMILLQSINFPLADFVTTVGEQVKRTIIMIIAMLVGVGSYIYLGGMYGSKGAAFSAIIIECTMLLGLLIVQRKLGMILLKGFIFNFVILLVTILFYNNFLINSIIHWMVVLIFVELIMTLLFIAFNYKLIRNLKKVKERRF